MSDADPNDAFSTPKRMRMTLACERCRTKKVKCDFAHPTCGRCEGAKGAPTQIDLFNLVQLNQTINSLKEQVDAIQSSLQQVHWDTQFIAGEIRQSSSTSGKRKRSPRRGSSHGSKEDLGLKTNWTLALTPSGLRIDTNIVSLHDLYDILLPSLSHIKHQQETVMIKQHPLYKTKDVIFPLYSAWEPNHHFPSTSSRPESTMGTATPVVKPDSHAQLTLIQRPALGTSQQERLLKIYSECFLCLPIPDVDHFCAQAKAGQICPLLMSSIFAWSARHAAIYHEPQEDPNTVGEHYFEQAKTLLRDRFLTASISTVHALLLMYIYSIGRTGPKKKQSESEAYIFLGLAVRMCLDLGLHLEPEEPPPPEEANEQELRRRVFAAAEFLETLYSAHSCDKPVMFPSHVDITSQGPSVMPHEQGEQRYRTAFTVHRHRINQIYRRIQAATGSRAPLSLATVSNLEQQLKVWHAELPEEFRLHPDRSWASSSFREQACLKLNFEYQFQMCQLYSMFLPHPDENSSAIALLSLRVCTDSADAIVRLLECWMQLQQPWCHFTLDTVVMACLIYSNQLRSSHTAVLDHAKHQMNRVARVLSQSPVRDHKYVKSLIGRIERQLNHGTAFLQSWGPLSSLDQEQEWNWTTPSLDIGFDGFAAELSVNDLFRFSDFIYTPTMDTESARKQTTETISYPWP